MGRRMNSKAQGMALDKIILIVLAVIVLIAVIFFVFKSNIVEKIRSGPGYIYEQEDKTVDIDKLDPISAKRLCPNRVGEINSESQTWFYTFGAVYIRTDTAKPGEKTLLIWDEDDGELELDELVNERIGTIQQRELLIKPEWFSAEMKNEHPKLPSADKLYLLNGSFRVEGQNKLCKTDDALRQTNDAIARWGGRI